MSFVNMERSSSIDGDTSSPHNNGRASATSLPAGRLPWAGTSSGVTMARTGSSPTPPAVTGTAPSASPRSVIVGWRSAPKSYCQFHTATWSSLCPNNSRRWPGRISGCSTACCSAPSPRRYLRSPPIHGISVPRSVSSRCCTPGARTCCTIPTSTAWCQQAGSHRTDPNGSLAARNSFLPVRVLSRLFRGKLLAFLREAYAKGKLQFGGQLAALADPARFQTWLRTLKKSDWVVYAKPPFGGPEHVLKYLARYTHRVAISNGRLVSLEQGQVRFRWRDSKDNNRTKTMTLDAIEFIRRFLLHILPSGFVKIRHFGFLANRNRSVRLDLCRRHLEAPVPADAPTGLLTDQQKRAAERRCPVCQTGTLHIVERLSAEGLLIRSKGVRLVYQIDSS